MRCLLLFLLLAPFSSSTSDQCPPGTECMTMRFCPSVEVETLDPDKFCGASGFLRYCCTPQIRQFPEGPKKPEEPQEPEEPHEPEEPQEPGKVRCFKDSDCPVTKLPSGFEDTLPDVKVYKCQETPSYECDFDDLNDYMACIEEKTCQPARVAFCTHPKGREHSACEVKESDLVYTLNEGGHIECNQDSDCPPAEPPSWEWNEMTKMENSITEMSISVPVCTPFVGIEGPSNISICYVKSEPFCGHEFGWNHPECQRCNDLATLPEPECLDYGLSKDIDIDGCCNHLFNDTIVEELKANDEDYVTSDIFDLREKVLQNFTINDCQLSFLHLPPDASPRTSFDPRFICCAFGYCQVPVSFGVPLTFLGAVTGIESLNPNSLSRSSPSCPSVHYCIRPSLARAGKLICCLLIRAPWGRRRIAICPNSCD